MVKTWAETWAEIIKEWLNTKKWAAKVVIDGNIYFTAFDREFHIVCHNRRNSVGCYITVYVWPIASLECWVCIDGLSVEQDRLLNPDYDPQEILDRLERDVKANKSERDE